MLTVGVVSTTADAPATVTDGLLLSRTGVSSLLQTAPVVEQARLPGSVTVTASLPSGSTVIVPPDRCGPSTRLGAGHLAVGDGERVVAQRRVADPDLAVEDGVECERRAAVVLRRHVLERRRQRRLRRFFGLICVGGRVRTQDRQRRRRLRQHRPVGRADAARGARRVRGQRERHVAVPNRYQEEHMGVVEPVLRVRLD